jgi:hypothetical protein
MADAGLSYFGIRVMNLERPVRAQWAPWLSLAFASSYRGEPSPRYWAIRG